jgi:hypothetical protein
VCNLLLLLTSKCLVLRHIGVKSLVYSDDMATDTDRNDGDVDVDEIQDVRCTVLLYSLYTVDY